MSRRSQSRLEGSLLGAGAFLLHDGHVLLGRRGSGEHEPLSWSTFGGMALPGETALECLKREVLEEAGINLDGCRATLLFRYHSDDGGFRYLTYGVSLLRHQEPCLTHETVEARWVPLGRSREDLWTSLPRPLHPGLLRLTNDPAACSQLLRLCDRQRRSRRVDA